MAQARIEPPDFTGAQYYGLQLALPISTYDLSMIK